MRRFIVPPLRDFVFVVIFLGGLAIGGRMLNTDSDLGRHLALGRHILTTGQVPTQDMLSVTRAGASRPPYEWLAQVIFAAVYDTLKWDGIVVAVSAVIAAAFAILYLDSYERSGAALTSLAMTAWSAAASSLHWLARPHVFSLLFFCIWLWRLERIRTGGRVAAWELPALMLIWVNTHGGFVFGFLACGAYLLGWLIERESGSANRQIGRRLVVITAASLVASLITPAWWRNWAAVLGNRSAYILSRTVETMPPAPSSPGTWPFFALIVLVLSLVALQRMKVAPGHFVLLSVLAMAALLFARNIPFFAIAAAPLCAVWLANLTSRAGRWTQREHAVQGIDRSLAGYVWPALIVAATLATMGLRQARTQGSVYRLDSNRFPVAAADWIVAHPIAGNMYNDFNWGGYLLFRLWPEHRVYIDSQSDFYGEAFVRQYASILGGTSGWDERLREQGVSWMIVPPAAPISSSARQAADWRVAYEDPVAVVFVRK